MKLTLILYKYIIRMRKEIKKLNILLFMKKEEVENGRFIEKNIRKSDDFE